MQKITHTVWDRGPHISFVRQDRVITRYRFHDDGIKRVYTIADVRQRERFTRCIRRGQFLRLFAISTTYPQFKPQLGELFNHDLLLTIKRPAQLLLKVRKLRDEMEKEIKLDCESTKRTWAQLRISVCCQIVSCHLSHVISLFYALVAFLCISINVRVL